MKKYLSAFWLISGLIMLLPVSVHAHTGIDDVTGFEAGFWHPIGGADHLLAMVAVGLWAAQMGGKSIWLVPATFVTLMLLGGILALSGIHFSHVEAGILISVLSLGILIAAALKFRPTISACIIGFFALFHGHAHGAEMPLAIEAAAYCFGFALSTALLHAIGIASGCVLHKLNIGKIVRWSGGVIAFSGIYLTIA
ncbi:HupE/UreJ family protein [Nitrosomonas sp. ANs5]|uniref:HupE/UreJ family protein n=1 Tax=Nitrosomonas sp. ANs5 TaxID=3423941 RepID=UPI003D324A93